MKKVLTMVVAAGLCLQLTACAVPHIENGLNNGGGPDASQEALQDIAESKVEENVERYVNGFLKAVFYGEYEQYLEYASASHSEKMHAKEVDYFVNSLIELTEVDADYVDASTMEGYRSVAETVLSSMKWEIIDIEVIDEVDQSGWVEMDMYPNDFFDLIWDDVLEAEMEFNAQLDKLDESDILVSQRLEQMEREYAIQIWLIADKYASQARPYYEAISWEYDFDLSLYDYVLAESSWDDIIDTLMNL